jgi:hypothetical protein
MDLRQLEMSMPKWAWSEVYTKVTRHTNGTGIADYLRIQRPSEPKEVLDFRIKTLNKLTKDIFRKGLNNAHRVLIETPLLLDANEEVMQLVEADNFDSHSGWVNLYSKIIDLLQNVIQDPNGLLIVVPINGTGEDISPLTVPLNERVYFYIDYVPSSDVIYYSTDMAIYKWKGYTFKDDKNEIYTLTEYNGKVIEDLWYIHNTGHKLSTYLGGYKSQDDNGKEYFDSFFDGAVEFADAFMNQYVNLQATMLQNTFPVREMREMPCNACNGKGRLPNDKGELEDCGTCKGSGKIINYNTNTVFIRPKKTSIAEDNLPVQQDPLITYYNPPIDGANLSYQFSFDLYNRAGEAIGATTVKMAQSGVAKEEDKESYYSMLSQIMSNTVRLYQFTISSIQSIWLNDQQTPISVKPKKDIRENLTDYLINKVNIMKELNVPEPIVSGVLSELLSKYSGYDDSVIIKVLPLVNPLFGKTMQDIVMLKSMAGSPVTDYALYVHLNGYRILKQMDLHEKTIEQIVQEFKVIAEREFNENRPLSNGIADFIQ